MLIPFSHLAEQGYPVFWIERRRIHEVDLKPYDLVVICRLSPRTAAEANQVMQMMRLGGQCLVWESDDDLTNLPPWNPAALEVDADRRAAIIEMVRHADAVTVTNYDLAQCLRQYNPSVWEISDMIDPDGWEGIRAPGRRTVPGLTIGLQGGNSHYEDWKLVLPVLQRVVADYPEVHVVVAGFHPDYLVDRLPAERRTLLPWLPLNQYPQVCAQMDIGLCPLLPDRFNACKEPIKAMEYALGGAAVVASPTVYSRLINHGTDGYLAYREEDWERYLRRLVERPRLRQQMAGALRQKVLRTRNIHTTATRWWRTYELIYQQFLRGKKERPDPLRTVCTTRPGFFAQLQEQAVGW